jgi:hypothetical protein
MIQITILSEEFFDNFLMLHEALVTLLGHPGDLFKKENLFKTTKGIDFLHISEQSALDRLGHLGFLYSQLNDYINKKDFTVFKSCLRNSISKYLDGYRGLIVSLEPIVLQPNSTVSEIQIEVEKVSFQFIQYYSVFDDLLIAIKDIEERNIHGVNLLNYIEQRRSRSGAPLSKQLFNLYLHG